MKSLSIVGAGITGLITAYLAAGENAWSEIHVFDSGPDPRSLSATYHSYGATYSGMDARHISITETGPWTASHRVELMSLPAARGGWNLLAGTVLSEAEEAWLERFNEIARDELQHRANTRIVYGINDAAMIGWEYLQELSPEIFGRFSVGQHLRIYCANAADILSEHQAEFALDRLVEPPQLASDRQIPHLRNVYGFFDVAGQTFAVKTLCKKIITHLENAGVKFHWEKSIDISYTLDGQTVSELAVGDVIWAAGAMSGSKAALLKKNILLQGVVGCWVKIKNPGFDSPFKILAPEPINFMNCTPSNDDLLISGGYGWVGTRQHDKVEILAQPLMQAFQDQVGHFLDARSNDPRICIRPSLPSGVTRVELEHDASNHRLVTCIGGAAGGFTQAPYVARLALKKLLS